MLRLWAYRTCGVRFASYRHLARLAGTTAAHQRPRTCTQIEQTIAQLEQIIAHVLQNVAESEQSIAGLERLIAQLEQLIARLLRLIAHLAQTVDGLPRLGDGLKQPRTPTPHPSPPSNRTPAARPHHLCRRTVRGGGKKMGPPSREYRIAGKLLAGTRSLHLGGVEEHHAHVVGLADDGDPLRPVSRWPVVRADAHAPVCVSLRLNDIPVSGGGGWATRSRASRFRGWTGAARRPSCTTLLHGLPARARTDLLMIFCAAFLLMVGAVGGEVVG